jgi:WD40 repeat protein/serine/threonine protein kinase
MQHSSDSQRDLLLGHLALELNFINAETLEAAKKVWNADKSKAMGQILVERQAITAHTRDVLENLVQLQANEEGHTPASNPDETDRGAVIPMEPPPEFAPGAAPSDVADRLRFHKIRPHAQGALGQVFLARDKELLRKVALKEIKDRYADNPDARGRFLLEAQITGRLEHPGVVPVYGLGAYENGRPFYAMRFIKGESMQDALKRIHAAGRLPADVASDIRKLVIRFVAVCNTMQYAHDRDVVHRDLKPGNIMLGAYGETLVVDWGLAKVLGKMTADPTGSIFEPLPSSGSSETLPGKAIGTLTYMSPEQAAGRLEAVSAQSDVYSLGATLFSILTGRASVEDSKAPDQTRVDLVKLQAKVIAGDIHKPTDLKPETDKALEAICMKAMALKPDHRYESSRAMANDLENWLANEPVSAYPEPFSVRYRRWANRNRGVVTGVIAASIIVFIAALSVAGIFAAQHAENYLARLRAEDAEKVAKDAEKEAKKAKEEAEIDRAKAVKAKLEAEGANAQLVDARKKAEKEAERANKEAARAKKSEKEAVDAKDDLVKTIKELEIQTDKANAATAAKSKLLKATEVLRLEADEERRKAERARDDALRAHAAEKRERALNTTMLAQARFSEGQVVQAYDMLEQVDPLYRHGGWNFLHRQFEGGYATLYGHLDAVRQTAFSPDGTLIASVSADGQVKLWDGNSGKSVLTIAGITTLAFSRDGLHFAAGAKDGTVTLREARTGKVVKSADKLHAEAITALALSPDGKRLAAGSQDGNIKVCDADSLGNATTLKKSHVTGVISLAFNPASTKLVSTGLDRNLIVWDVASGDPQQFPGQTNGIAGAVFSADGKHLAFASIDDIVKMDIVRVWKTDALGTEVIAAAPQVKGESLSQSRGITSITISPDGQRIATTGFDGAIRLLSVNTGRERHTLHGHSKAARSVAFSPDGQRLVSGSDDFTVKLWDVVSGQETQTFIGNLKAVSSIAFNPTNDNILASGNWNGTLKVWNVLTGKDVWASAKAAHASEILSVAFASDGQRLASAGQDGKIKLWDAATGKELATAIKGHAGAIMSVAFSKDGKRLASGGKDKSVIVWDAVKGDVVWTSPAKTYEVNCVSLSADGSRVAWADQSGAITIADLPKDAKDKDKEPVTFHAHSGGITSVTFGGDEKNPDKIIATAGQDGRVALWDAVNGQLLLVLKGHGSGVMSVAFSKDGKRLASASKDGTVKMWDAKTGQDIKTYFGHGDLVTSVAFSPKGDMLASASLDRTVKLWEAGAVKRVQSFKGEHAKPIRSVLFSNDGKKIYSRDEAGKNIVWNASDGKLLPDEKAPVAAGHAAISPDGKKIALPFSTWFYLIDIDPSKEESDYRDQMGRLKPWWHEKQADDFDKAKRPYAAAYYWSWAVRGDASQRNRERFEESLKAVSPAEAETLRRQAGLKN